MTRDYILHVPANYDTSNSVAAPLLLDYHGWTGSAQFQIDNVPWTQLADTEGFIYVSMEGMSDVQGGGRYGSWNVSATEGPLGLTCDTSLGNDILIYINLITMRTLCKSFLKNIYHFSTVRTFY